MTNNEALKINNQIDSFVDCVEKRTMQHTFDQVDFVLGYLKNTLENLGLCPTQLGVLENRIEQLEFEIDYFKNNL